LREILSNYGEITEVWFDGAKGPNAKNMEYDWQGYYSMIRELQPNAVIAICGPDVRWVGNESGYAGETEWSVVNRSAGNGQNLAWHPAETDVSIRPGWFYHASQDDEVKTVEKLLEIYFTSVGRNSVLLLNLPPDQRGLIHENDVQRLRELRKVLNAIFDENLAAGAKAKASHVKADNPAFGADKIADGDKNTYWTTDDWTAEAFVEFDLGQERTFNVAEVAEYIALGQRVEEFVLEAWAEGRWKEFARGTTIGYKRLLRFDEVTTSRVKLSILGARVCPTLSGFGLYSAPSVDEILSQ